MRRTLLVAIASLVLTLVVSCSRPLGDWLGDQRDRRPNFLFIITDDQRYDTIEYMPRTQARIFDEGISFTSAYVTTPLCCPSRASILTGMYAHKHQVWDNREPLEEKTFVVDLHEAGYLTGMVGKYLNSWAPDFGDDPPRPEFDFWVAHGGLAAVRDTFYFAPTLNVEGEWIEHEGYATHVVRDYALEFLDEASQLQAPFLLIFAPFAPHKPADPAPGDENLYQDLPAFRPPSFNEAVISDKPAWLVEKARRTPEEIESIDQFRRRQLQSLNAVDEAVESLLLELERQGNLDKTVVIFVSDNGEFWGEHRLESKEWLYEEAVRVPFALRYPPLVEGQRVENRLVANIDIAPTVYELAGLPIPENLDGRSLVPLLEGTDEWREELILETWANDGTYFQAIHTGRYVYVSEEGNPSEFFDLRDDPFQLENVLGSPDYAYIEVELKMRLDAAGGLVEGQAADE